jgi:transposase
MGRSRGGLTSKIHAVVDSTGLPTRLALSPGEAHDVRLAGKLLSRLKPGSMLLADRGYDADWIRELAMKKGACANIPRKAIAAIRSASARTFALATRSNGSSTGSNNVVVWRRAIFNWLCHGHDAKRRERRYGHRNGFSTASGTRPQPNGRGYATVLNLLTSESARPTSIWGKPNESANPGIANAVVLTGEAVVSDTYVKRMEQDYAAKVLNNARHEDINGWVKRMTAGRIASILDRP